MRSFIWDRSKASFTALSRCSFLNVVWHMFAEKHIHTEQLSIWYNHLRLRTQLIIRFFGFGHFKLIRVTTLGSDGPEKAHIGTDTNVRASVTSWHCATLMVSSVASLSLAHHAFLHWPSMILASLIDFWGQILVTPEMSEMECWNVPQSTNKAVSDVLHYDSLWSRVSFLLNLRAVSIMSITGISYFFELVGINMIKGVFITVMCELMFSNLDFP